MSKHGTVRQEDGLVVDLRLRRGETALDLHFALGREVVSVIGPNGAGKTSLLMAVLGLLQPDEGYISCGGCTLFDSRRRVALPTERRGLGYLPQGQGLLPHMTALGNVTFAIACGTVGLDRKSMRRLAWAALERVGVAELGDRRPSQLSGGECQRVALARTLASEPAALLCDEPLAALSPDARPLLRALLVDSARHLAVPTLVVTHLLDDVLAIGGRVLVVENGQVVALASAVELCRRPPSPFVAQFFESISARRRPARTG